MSNSIGLTGFLKREKKFLLIFGFSIIIFLWDLFFLKKTFILGDYRQQFFPWSMEYASAIKHFTLPFWSRYMGCGFPLVAEGQVGPFYPLNMILFFILPPIAAYSYSIILHFILGGIFMYIFAKKIGLKDIAAIMPSILFMFASPYAGCFSNIASLKALCWFPLVLYIIYFSFEKGKPYILSLSGIVMGIQLLAGAPQMASYSIMFSVLYFFFMFIRTEKSHKTKYAAAFVLSSVVALIISAPQIISSNTLVSLSNRNTRDLSFALAKSFLPPGILTLIFPSMAGIFEGMLYIGILPLILALTPVFGKNNNKKLLFFSCLFLISFLCATGRYNPLYVASLKIAKFYLFRIPSKFLFFSGFSLIILSGFGLQNILNSRKEEKCRNADTVSLAVLAVSVISLISANAFLRIWKRNIVSFIKEYVTKHFYNPSLHRHPIQYYMEKVDNLYQNALNAVSFSNIYIDIQLIILLFSVALVILYKRAAERKYLYKNLFIYMIFIDLIFFSLIGTGFRGNIAEISSVIKEPEEVSILKKDNSLFRVYLFQGYESQGALQPNMNMFFKIGNIGVYSPLVSRRYSNLLGEIGCVDDSTGVTEPSQDSLKNNLKLLNMLNVKYIITEKELSMEGLGLLKNTGDGRYIYINKNVMPRAFIVHSVKTADGENRVLSLFKENDFNPADSVILEGDAPDIGRNIISGSGKSSVIITGYSDRKVVIKTGSDKPGILVLSDCYYPGWKGYLDGRQVQVLRADYILRAVYLPKGEHEVKFIYSK